MVAMAAVFHGFDGVGWKVVKKDRVDIITTWRTPSDE
jgi:hypothetical protein